MCSGSGRGRLETRFGKIHFGAKRHVAQAKVPSGTGIRDRGIHVAGEGNGGNWRFATWLLRGRETLLRGQVGNWIHAGYAQIVARETGAAGEERLTVCRRATRDAKGRTLGQAGPRRAN